MSSREKWPKYSSFGTGGLRTQNGTLDWLAHLKCLTPVLVSLPALFKQIWQSSTLNVMADQHNNYDILENSFQSSAPVTFYCFYFGCNFISLGVNGEEKESVFFKYGFVFLTKHVLCQT